MEGRPLLTGNWVSLEPLSADNAAEVARLGRHRELMAQMGGAQERRDPPRSFGLPLVVRLVPSGEVVGLMENGEMTGYPGVAVIVVYVDPRRARAGAALEAYVMYVDYVFASGARVVHIEVMSFNREVLSLLRKARQVPQATLRDHAYVAGRYWDLIVFGFSHAEWMVQVSPWRRLAPGGDRKPKGFGRTQTSAPE